MFSQSACAQRIDAKTAIIIKRAHLGRADFSMVEVEAVEFKNSLNVPYIIYHLIINKSSEFMKKNQYFFGLSSKKVCCWHIV